MENTTANTSNADLPSFPDIFRGLTVVTMENATEFPQQLCNNGPWFEFLFSFTSFYTITLIAVCVFGIITNTLNIVVFTREGMACTTNSILTWQAVADLCFMLVHLPSAVHHHIVLLDTACQHLSRGWAVYMLTEIYINGAHQGVSIGLTITLAVWRLLAVRFPLKCRVWCSRQRTLVAVTMCYIIPILLLCSTFPILEIREKSSSCTHQEFQIHVSDFARASGYLALNVYIFVLGFLTKIIPGLVLIILFSWLLWALHVFKIIRRSLMTQGASKPRDSTSCMLLVVLFMYMLTEMPFGIIVLFESPLLIHSSLHLGECLTFITLIFHLLTIINNATTFFVYCCMSGRFRNRLILMFKSS